MSIFTSSVWAAPQQVSVTFSDGSFSDRDTLSGYFQQDRETCELHERIVAAAPAMLGAIQTFCDRVEAGTIRSRKTYAAFKAITDQIEGRDVA